MTIIENLRPLAVPVGSLRLLEGNPRVGDVDAVAASLARFGQRKPIVARSDGTVVAGNHTLQAARSLFWDEIAVVYVDDDDATAKAYALADNRTAELGGYDDEALRAMVLEVQAFDEALLADTGWAGDDLEALLADPIVLPPPLDDPDNAPDPPTESVSALGDVWLLGAHRVMCGDSTEAEHIETLIAGSPADLVWGDPPYGVKYVGKTKQALTIQNDGGANQRGFVADALLAVAPCVEPGSPFYLAVPAGPQGTECRLGVADAGWALHEELVWVKDAFVLGHSDYHYRHEPILYGWLPGPGRSGRGNHAGTRWFGDHAQTTVMEVPRPRRSETHPTMKPVELIAPCLTNSSQPGDIVLDPFGGSGSTLIAAYQTGRVARLVELDPRYVDVICRRYQQATGDKPILEATGEPHDFEGE